jgi:hypothetical protein
MGATMERFPMRSVLVAVALVAFASISARANTITPVFTGFTPGVSVSYDAQLTSGELRAGDGFTIFDVGGFAGFINTAANWSSTATFTTSPFGTPLSATDDPALVNVHYTYGGATIVQLGTQTFSPFIIATTSTAVGVDDWVSRDHLLGGGGGTSETKALTVVPVAPAVVPDGGSTLVFLGVSLLTVGAVRRRTMS